MGKKVGWTVLLKWQKTEKCRTMCHKDTQNTISLKNFSCFSQVYITVLKYTIPVILICSLNYFSHMCRDYLTFIWRYSLAELIFTRFLQHEEVYLKDIFLHCCNWGRNLLRRLESREPELESRMLDCFLVQNFWGRLCILMSFSEQNTSDVTAHIWPLSHFNSSNNP